MKSRDVISPSIVVVIVTIVALAILLFHRPLLGLYSQRFGRWGEEGFIGKPFSDLQSMLSTQGRSLRSVDAASFYALTDLRLTQNQRAFRFVKGKRYRWFLLGTAVNVGYVVVENSAKGDFVVEIIRGRSVDTL